jgi:glucose/arabinose dehydrogenase
LQLREIAANLENPVLLTHAPDSPAALYVLEQPGRIRVVTQDGLRDAPFLDISGRVGSSGSEQGLLGLAFSPDFAKDNFLYVNYTGTDGGTVVSRFLAKPDRSSADPKSEFVILKQDQPYANHNGGNLAFGPDGMLYIGFGDGGSGGDPENRAQNTSTLLGKLLRIDVRGAKKGAPYAVPADNPKLTGDAKPEIWALGLRNPWRFSFDRANGDLYIGDVGQNAIEEVDYLPAGQSGANFGWKLREGDAAYDGGEKSADMIDPVAVYPHAEGCSVIGGFVYRGGAIPSLTGAYVFGDYCNGSVWKIQRGADGGWTKADKILESGAQISSFGEDLSGELYLVDHNGTVHIIVAAP